jgi:hypothetical protein
LFLFFLPVVFSSALALGADHMTIACIGGKVYPSPTAPAIENAVLLIENAKIATVATQSQIKYDLPHSAQRLDCKGKVIVAGPVGVNQTGVRYFCSFSDAVVRANPSASITTCDGTVTPLQ